MLIDQKLDSVISMLPKVSFGQVGGSFPPETHVIALEGWTGHYWSSHCPALVYFWLSGWDKNHRYSGIYYSNPVKVNTAASKQDTIIDEIKFKNLKIEYCSKNQIFTVNIKTPKKSSFCCTFKV